MGILRGAERTGVEAIAATDAQIFGMEHDRFVGRIEAGTGQTAAQGASVQCIQAMEKERSPGFPSLIVTTRRPVNFPWHFMLVFAGGDTGIALDAAVGIAQKLHPRHDPVSLCRSDLTERGFRFLHAGDRIVTIGR